jgi:RsiW-degrading membrane proteinase PrsW (M82 family)
MIEQITEILSKQQWLLAAILWSAIVKLTALWYAGKNEQKGWFVIIGIFNTLGILPLIYLLIFRREK